MGTNVYAHKIKIAEDPDFKKILNKIVKSIQNEDFELLDELNEERVNKWNSNIVHIGKRSGGWKFLFNHNNWKYYDYTRESINNFLKSCYKIVNEYGQEITPEEFWKEYVDDMSDGMNGKQYCEYELDRAKAKEEGKIEDKFNFYMTVSQARQHYEDGLKHNWYEAQICTFGDKEQQIPYEKLDYRFSYSTEFS